MGRKRLKHLGKKRKTKNKFKSILKKIILVAIAILAITSSFKITRYLEELYKSRNIEDCKIEFYMDVSDETGDNKIQLSWKELMAIDMVRYNNKLTDVKKKDTLKLGKMFIQKENKDKYSLKSFDVVLNELNFKKEEKKKANDYLKKLDDVFLGDIDLQDKSNKVSFINSIEQTAIENYREYKILPSVTIAQSILESGWGTSELTKASNNMFGIKADKNWLGKSVEVATSENYNDKITASFRVYDSVEQSIKDHGKFLWDNKRYKENGFFEATHYKTQAQALEDAGYSTKEDENGNKVYADTLVKVIKAYNLQLIDHEVELKIK
ncbi:mannosyl-glycoprotein endo-beta-N-acetylglucosamidase [Romboutsia maritimum]|uniref:Mannosyl-glycoprotein endo-beta-N-acetylglucosamidase n=1 Tax=Romboutsia maritimum TaxID=2020948 RepID=A0A371IT51_9FIRM|nr:glucosaminidase domain-containing protein [Romboutsia maritimum]RDY23635.1 mannosyl-glycoprotein endo-beta-N-acetylglucosamidase [Romboutsia maritimum]